MTCLPAGFDLESLDDRALSDLVAAALGEQQRRAVAVGDPEALVEQGFRDGFGPRGAAVDPWLVGGLLVCAGSIIGPTKGSHECTFAKVAGQWAWQADEKILDVVRPLPDGPRPQQRSVTVLAVYEGLEVDLITAKCRSGVHRMERVRSFKVTAGHLVATSARAVRVDGHSR